MSFSDAVLSMLWALLAILYSCECIVFYLCCMISEVHLHSFIDLVQNRNYLYRSVGILWKSAFALITVPAV